MPQDKKPPRFVPTLTEVVPGRVQTQAEIPTALKPMNDASRAESELLLADAMAAAETFMARRMPELVAQHMAACELQLRQELESTIKTVLEARD